MMLCCCDLGEAEGAFSVILMGFVIMGALLLMRSTVVLGMVGERIIER